MSFRRKASEVWAVGQIDWKVVQHLTLSQQYKAYVEASLSAFRSVEAAPRRPKEFDATRLREVVAGVLHRAKPSAFTRSSALRRGT